MVYKFSDKKKRSGASVNKYQAEELYKQVIKKFKRRKVYVSFKNDICATYFAQIRSLPSSNRVVTHLLCATSDLSVTPLPERNMCIGFKYVHYILHNL